MSLRSQGSYSYRVFSKSGVPAINLPTGTWGGANTGAMTLGTALPYTPNGTVTVYVTNSGMSNAAGMYYATFTSTTACVITTDAAGLVPVSNTASAAYTATTSGQNLITVSIPGNTLGPNGQIRLWVDFACASNATGPYLTTFLGSATIENIQLNSALGYTSYHRISNRNATGVQIISGGVNTSFSGATHTYSTVDTTASQNIILQTANSVATSYSIIDSYAIEILPG